MFYVQENALCNRCVQTQQGGLETEVFKKVKPYRLPAQLSDKKTRRQLHLLHATPSAALI